MKIAFLNPQGNFDEKDSYLTEHPDFGGQLIYVKEVCKALSELDIQVDIITRKIIDENWKEFSDEIDFYQGYKNLRIVRIPFGGDKFLNKENLWEHIPEFVRNIIKFYHDDLPDFVTAHYADGGYAAVLLKEKTGINFSFTGHSLGAQKLDKLRLNLTNYDDINNKYYFNKRIMAERFSMIYASKIITSTSQERFEQYSHMLYKNAIDVNNLNKFSIIPPGVNTKIFNNDYQNISQKTINYLNKITQNNKKSYIILSSRLDEKKNHLSAVKAYAESRDLQENSNLAIFLRNITNPYDLDNVSFEERKILEPIINIIKKYEIENKVYFFDLRSQKELADAYKYFAQMKSIFCLTAFYEPFGLAPIEAGACGLAVVATENGGPQEIFEDGSGLLVDPENIKDISEKLLIAIKDYEILSKKIINRVYEKYTWNKTAEKYLEVAKKEYKNKFYLKNNLPELNAEELIKSYLSN